jgi:hypothetical protein
MTVVEKARIALDPKRLNLPERPVIEAIEVEDYADWEGEDALRVRVILAEDTKDEEISGEAFLDLKTQIRDALLAQGIEQFPYMFVAKRSELEAQSESE